MRTIKMLLVLVGLLAGVGSYAQTVITFTAGVDKGKNTKYKTFSAVGDELSKDGVTMKSANALFGGDGSYSLKTGTVFSGNLTISCDTKPILSVELEGVENAGLISAAGYDADAAKWEGQSQSVTLSVAKGEVKFTKVTVTILDKYTTALAFDASSLRAVLGVTSTVPAPTLTSGGSTVEGKAFTYASSYGSVAGVDATTGELTLNGEGMADITATFAGDDDYLGSSATAHLYVLDSQAGDVVLYESFSNLSGKGGNDGQWNFTSTSGMSDGKNFDNEGWDVSGFVYDANGSLRIERASSATTPALGIDGDARLTFLAGSLRNSGSVVTVAVDGDGTADVTELTAENGMFGFYTVNLTGLTAASRVVLKSNTTILDDKGFIIDDLTVHKVDVPSSINGAAAGSAPAAEGVYTIGGVRVADSLKSLPKGIYVVGGKKVIVK